MKRLAVRVIEADDGTRRLASPDVAVFRPGLSDGDLVRAGTVLGTARRIDRESSWIVPEGTPPSVLTEFATDRRVPLEYGEPFAVLKPIATGSEVVNPVAARAAARHVLAAPTDGVFYRSPSPDAPPFVAAGDLVSDGDPVGLIEVMKTFSRVGYGGERLPVRARIVEFLAADGEEVLAGRPLLSVEPASDVASD